MGSCEQLGRYGSQRGRHAHKKITARAKRRTYARDLRVDPDRIPVRERSIWSGWND
jgi:hypothetical protein